ncbi:hypothetical protein [Moraxella lacunata]|uniref:hypothetical protein n=1 Tax=Moraxella lacunata TaxID=477 RepID=UPI003EE3B9AE
MPSYSSAVTRTKGLAMTGSSSGSTCMGLSSLCVLVDGRGFGVLFFLAMVINRVKIGFILP